MPIKFWAVQVAAQKLAASSRSGLALDFSILQPQLFQDDVNEMGLGKVDCAILVSLDVDSKEVRYISLNSEVKASILHVLENMVQLSYIWTGQDGVISVQDIDALASCENTFISVALVEPNGFELVDKVSIPNSACLFFCPLIFLWILRT